VSGGKYVAPGVFVGVEQGATTQSSRAKVEVEITHHITGYSSVGSTSSQVGVNWRYDY
jgi:translocation and assembly module TamB